MTGLKLLRSTGIKCASPGYVNVVHCLPMFLQSSMVVALLVCSRGACNAQLFVLMCALGTSSKPDVHAIAHARAHTHIHCFLPLYFTPVGINVLVHRMASMFWETFAFQMFELSHHYHLTYFSKADYLHIS